MSQNDRSYEHEHTLILTERQVAILQTLIEEYIATAQPISSSMLADRPDIRASSATVRNEMARLEELGLLYQPHTSAGRIPTDLGYRYYVDHVLKLYGQSGHTLSVIQHDPGIEATCRLLGDLTRYTALALVPGWQEHRLQHIELAPVGQDQLLVMLVTDDHQVLHSLSTISGRPDPARLRQLNDLLNSEFSGKTLSQLTEDALTNAVNKLPHISNEFFRQTPEFVRRGLPQERATPRIYVEGTTHIFEQQEFSNLPKLRALMEALHEESVFERLFSNTKPGEIQVSIGAENPHSGLEDCAVVFTSYHITEHATGRVGVLGPKRMKYRQVIGTMAAVVNNLDKRMQSPGQEA
jgi:heat-inducible transcriptional repressor